VIVRLLTQDDARQSSRARAIFERETKIFIAESVLLETEWVLRFAYGFKKQQVVDAFRKLLGLKSIRVNDGWVVRAAIDWHEQGLDFADALHLATGRDATTLLTFDRPFVKAASKLAGNVTVKEA